MKHNRLLTGAGIQLNNLIRHEHHHTCKQATPAPVCNRKGIMNASEIVRALREKAGISQPEMARRIGVCTQSICNWEKGYKCPTADKLLAVCNAMGYDVIIKPKYEVYKKAKYHK